MLNQDTLLWVTLISDLTTLIIPLIVIKAGSFILQHVGDLISNMQVVSQQHLELGLIIVKVHVIDMGVGRGVFVVSICKLIFAWENDHKGLDDVCVQVIHVTDIKDPTCREAFRIDKLETSVPLELNDVAL